MAINMFGRTKEEIKNIMEILGIPNTNNSLGWTHSVIRKTGEGLSAKSATCEDITLLSIAEICTQHRSEGISLLKEFFLQENKTFRDSIVHLPKDSRITVPEATCWAILALSEASDSLAYDSMEALKDIAYDKDFGLFCTYPVRNHPIPWLKLNSLAILALNKLEDKLAYSVAEEMGKVLAEPESKLFKESTFPFPKKASLKDNLLAVMALAKVGTDISKYMEVLKEKYWNEEYSLLLYGNNLFPVGGGPFVHNNSLFAMICKITENPLESIVLQNMKKHFYDKAKGEFANIREENIMPCGCSENILAVLAFNGYTF